MAFPKKKHAIEGVLLLIWCILAFLLLSQKNDIQFNLKPKNAFVISGEWYYCKDGEKTEVSLPADILLEDGESLTLFCDALTSRQAGAFLMMKGVSYDPVISVGDEVIYQYEDSAFPRNKQMAAKMYTLAALPESYNGETIAITFQNAPDGLYELSEICVGDEDEIYYDLWSKNWISYSIIFILAILSIFTLCIAVSLRVMGAGGMSFIYLAEFLIACVCWFFMDSSLMQTISGTSTLPRYASFYALMLMGIPMLHFVKSAEGMQKYRSIDWAIYVYLANAILQSILNCIGAADFIDMLFITHILMIVGIGILVSALVREYRASCSTEVHNILKAFVVLATFDVISLCVYWGLSDYYEDLFESGIVIFAVILLQNLVVNMVQNLKFRTENMIYQKLAKEDYMTGMKNRRAFEEALEVIEQTAAQYQNLYLIFIDLNRLKFVNDTLGHQIGDEMIIASSQCILETFGPYGDCYRIGGDEFCAILPDITMTERELSGMLDAQVKKCNLTLSSYQVSMAVGISNIRDEQGHLKTVSDWKGEADLKMYDNKGWVRRDTQAVSEQ